MLLVLIVCSLAETAPDADGGLRVFRPLSDPAVPAVADASWPDGPLDRFVLAGLEARGLRPAPAASRRDLLRRVTFDLTGLPPEPSAVEAFLAEPAPDAHSRLVDRLLASPRYGERWGRHWLDVARYADSNGLDENVAHGHAWRYRDWVIDSFNSGMPYDRFVLEQLAGDLLPPADDDRVAHGRLIATGFLSLGPKVLAEGDVVKMEMDIIDEQIDTLGKAFLGLTLGCARCHDHKYDPVRMEDYYALAGIFKSTRTMESFKRIARWHENSLATPEERARREAHDARVAALKKELEKTKKGGGEDDEKKTAVARLEKEIAELEKAAPELASAMGVARGEPADLRVHLRGDHLTLGEPVERGIPAAFPGGRDVAIGETESGRLALARWLGAGGRAATSRVMANRIWRWHLDEGLVRTADNFGSRGEEPADPALLDWLASRFIESGWSIKRMHRHVLLSKTYRMSAARDEAAERSDPENRLRWRWTPRRLEAEEVRDALLAVSGLLDLRMGGSILHVANREFLFDHTSRDTTSYDSRRRSIYLPVIRNHLHDVFELFDFPDPATVGGDRAETTVPAQALFLMNGELVLRASDHLAAALLDRPGSDVDRVRALHLRAYGRPPSEKETRRALEFVAGFDEALAAGGMPDDEERRLRAWSALCQATLVSNEFLRVR